MGRIPKTRFCTIADIAKKTDLATTTVYRALHNYRDISSDTLEFVRKAILELNEEAIRRYRAELSASLEVPVRRRSRGSGFGKINGSQSIPSTMQEHT